MAFARNHSQRPDEAGCVSRSKQLFWVSAISFTTHFNRTIELEVDLPIVRFHSPDSAAGRSCVRGVNSTFDCHIEAPCVAFDEYTPSIIDPSSDDRPRRCRVWRPVSHF